MAMLTAVGTLPDLSFVATPAIEDPDHALARRACAGEVAAFEDLYRRNAGRVHGVIARLFGGRSGQTEELAQDAFVRAWQALPRYRFESAFSTWLHRVAVESGTAPKSIGRYDHRHILHLPIGSGPTLAETNVDAGGNDRQVAAAWTRDVLARITAAA